MKLTPLALAAALTAVWAAFPLAARAQDDDRDGEEETIEVRKRMRRGDGGGDRERGPRERRDGREGPRGMGEEREGPRGMGGRDPEMREKMEKLRELEEKTRDLAKTVRQGADAEKAAAKTELRKVLGELFDAKLAMDEAMLVKLEKHAAEVKARIAKKKSSRDKAIENRLSRMTGEGDDW